VTATTIASTRRIRERTRVGIKSVTNNLRSIELRNYGSAQEFVETRILGCFLENDEFGLGDRHALGLEQ
jgi:hypothetical protein